MDRVYNSDELNHIHQYSLVGNLLLEGAMKVFFIGCGIVMLLSSCASKEENMAYYSAVAQVSQNDAQASSQAAVAQFNAVAALKDNPMALMALAFMARDMKIEVHNLSGIDSPDDASEVFKSITPFLSTAVVWGAGAWGLTEVMNSAGSSYQAYDNGRINGQDSTQIDPQTGNGDGVSTDPPDEEIEDNCVSECLKVFPTGKDPSGCSCHSSCTTDTCTLPGFEGA